MCCCLTTVLVSCALVLLLFSARPQSFISCGWYPHVQSDTMPSQCCARACIFMAGADMDLSRAAVSALLQRWPIEGRDLSCHLPRLLVLASCELVTVGKYRSTHVVKRVL